VRTVEELEHALEASTKSHPNALIVATDPLLFSHHVRILEAAQTHRLLSMFRFRQFAEAGGLMSYGASVLRMWRRTAYFVDCILKGAKPSELPVEQPTQFELVINLKTAKALGPTIPSTLLFLADEVIR